MHGKRVMPLLSTSNMNREKGLDIFPVIQFCNLTYILKNKTCFVLGEVRRLFCEKNLNV